LILTQLNGRTIRVSGAVSTLNPVYDEDANIISIANEETSYTTGSIVRVKPKIPYKVNLIVPAKTDQGVTAAYDLSVANLTKASIFAFPFLGGKRSLFLWDKFFVNSFIGTKDDSNIIALLYRFSGDTLFTKFEHALRSFGNFKYEIDPDPYHVLFVFDVPDTARSSYDHFVQGRYSQIDDFNKLKILDFHGYNMESRAAQILFKSESLRRELELDLDVSLSEDSELHSTLDLEEEIFNEEYYKIPSKTETKFLTT